MSDTVAKHQPRSSLADLASTFFEEIVALQDERDAWRTEAETVKRQHELERARERRRLEAIRAAMEVEMADRGRLKRMNPAGAARVEAWLAQAQRSQTWLAAQVGVSQPHLGYVLRGERVPSAELVEAIARVTGVSVEELWPVAQEVAS